MFLRWSHQRTWGNPKQVKTVDILADTTFGEDNDGLKNIKSAFLLFCQGHVVSVV